MKLNANALNSSSYFTFDDDQDLANEGTSLWLSNNSDELKVLGYEDQPVYCITHHQGCDEMVICYDDETEDSYPLDTDIQFNIYTLKEVI